MVAESKPGSGHGEGRKQPVVTWKGFQVENIRWEWPNPKGVGVQKLMPHEHIAGMLNAVGSAAQNATQNGHRAWEGLIQQGICSSKFCKLEFPKAWGGKGREVSSRLEEQGEPARAAAVSTRYDTESGTHVF